MVRLIRWLKCLEYLAVSLTALKDHMVNKAIIMPFLSDAYFALSGHPRN